MILFLSLFSFVANSCPSKILFLDIFTKLQFLNAEGPFAKVHPYPTTAVARTWTSQRALFLQVPNAGVPSQPPLFSSTIYPLLVLQQKRKETSRKGLGVMLLNGLLGTFG